MGYRAVLETTNETVQDLEYSASRRLDEARSLQSSGHYHSAIYLAGLAAEMYLKTACFFVGGALPAYPVDALRKPYPNPNLQPFRADFESGHGIWFWSQELIEKRSQNRLRKVPKRFLRVVAHLYDNWYIGMRYRPGFASDDDAAHFIAQVKWLSYNHLALRR